MCWKTKWDKIYRGYYLVCVSPLHHKRQLLFSSPTRVYLYRIVGVQQLPHLKWSKTNWTYIWPRLNLTLLGTLYFYIHLFSAIFTDQQPVIQNVCKKQEKEVWSCFRKAKRQTKIQSSAYWALTVCGGHPLAIVSKSSQCHIEVWDYLRKYSIWQTENWTENWRLIHSKHTQSSFLWFNPRGKDYFCF